MTCPNCQQIMESGVVDIHATVASILIYGAQREHLWFRSTGGPTETDELVLNEDDKPEAFCCRPCKLVLFRSPSLAAERPKH
jgi:uncharacterized protein DUF6487